MAGEKDMKQSEQITPAAIPDSSMKLSENDMGKERVQLDLDASASGIKGGMDQPLALQQGGYCPPTSCYDYYYPGYDGTFTQSDDKGYFNTTSCPYPGVQSDNPSLLYCVPGYGPYPTGFVGVDGEQTFTSSDYLQQPSLYGSDAFSSYTYDSTYAGNGSSGNAARSGSILPSLKEPSGSGNSNGFSHAKTNNYSNRTSPSHFNSRVQQPTFNFSRSAYQNYPLKPMDKMGSGYQSAGLMKGFHPTGKYSPYFDVNSGGNGQQGLVNYHYNGREWSNNNYRQKSRENFGRSGELEYATELTRGPRGDNRNNSMKLSAEVKLAPAIERDLYNLQEFQTEYDNAKFYVIKSYSEDDIHKCIKYGVWSSTPNGNKKLDAAFREADAKTSEIGVKCPVFLLFSVNGSGQFVGVAEMLGQVDFSKNMDFWQLDKWNGFFPVKWHIIKDVPNAILRHIIVESNENKSVTSSRDTQEIGLKQGTEILGIFKNYTERTCVLDDFNFYEDREKLLKAKRNGKLASQTIGFKNGGDYVTHFEAAEVREGERAAQSSESDPSLLVSLTQNLSINSHSLKGGSA